MELSHGLSLIIGVLTVMSFFGAIIGSHVTNTNRIESLRINIEGLTERKKSEIARIEGDLKDEVSRLEKQHKDDILRIEIHTKQEIQRLEANFNQILNTITARFEAVDRGIITLVGTLGEMKGEMRARKND